MGVWYRRMPLPPVPADRNHLSIHSLCWHKVTRKRTGGSRVCKEFAPLGRVELIGADGGMPVFGLNVLDGEGGRKKCLVFKGGASSDSTAAFIAALQTEMDMVQLRRKSEVLLPGATNVATEMLL